MKLAFSTLGCPEWNIEQVLDAAARWGYQAVELRGIQTGIEPDDIVCLSADNRDATLEAFRKNGIDICVFGTSVNFHDPQTVEKQYEAALKALEFCSQCKIPMMRVFGNKVELETEQEQLLQIANYLDKLCKEAEKCNLKVLLEVHGNLTTIERLRFVAERVQSTAFGLIWDVGHTHSTYGHAFETFYRALKPWICHVHIKDAVHIDGTMHHLCAVGDGSLPLGEIIDMLESDGYQGYYSLEWEKRWHKELDEPEKVFPAYVDWMNRR